MEDDDITAKTGAVKQMVEMLECGEATEAQIALLRYWIEGEPYPASALTLSPDYTPNLEQTESGLVCDAFFPDEMLSPHGQLQGQRIENGLLRVRLEVKLEDIVAVMVATESGPQITLYMVS